MPVFGRLPLSLRVPLIVALLMLVVAVVASRQVLSSLDQLQATRIRELAQLHVEELAVALGPHVLRDDIWEIYDTLQRAAGQSEGRRTVFSAVSDTQGRILAATDPRRAPVDSLLADLAEGAQRPADLTVVSKVDRVKLLAPLRYQGRHVGNILTELDISDIIADRRRAQRLLLLGNAVVALVLAGLGYVATRRMLVPLARLVARMQSAEGAPAPIPQAEMRAADTEMARLMHSYNAMVEAVNAKSETERRLAERERFVSLGRLSSSLAHEINNPLGGLLNATDTIMRYADRPEVVRQSAGLLDRGLRHMRDVAKATLELNRMDRTDQPIAPEDFEDLRLLIGPETTHHAQDLAWSVGTDLQRAGKGLPAAQVRQIALNLLLNASKAAGNGGRISFAAEGADDDWLHIAVGDSGPGLDASARARLLDEGPVPPGGGVGLRMVHDLVRQLGGRITVADGSPGTRIRVSLPPSAQSNEAGAEPC